MPDRVIILDIETILDPEMGFEPKDEKDFAAPPFWQIVAFGAMYWDGRGPRKLGCLGEEDDFSEAAALRAFANLLKPRTLLVTFNGRGFDLPVIVARAMKHRVQLPEYFRGRDMRYRYGHCLDGGHLDLCDQLADFGASRRASLDAWTRLTGGEGKGDITGADVAGLVAAADYERVRRYCLGDVVDTANLWLEYRYLAADLNLQGLADGRAQVHQLAEATLGEAARD